MLGLILSLASVIVLTYVLLPFIEGVLQPNVSGIMYVALVITTIVPLVTAYVGGGRFAYLVWRKAILSKYRILQLTLFSGVLPWFLFFGLQFVIAAAIFGL